MTYLQKLASRIRRAVPPDLIPADADHLFLLYAVLARAKGRDVQPEDVHDAWVAWMHSRAEAHESMVPFRDLTADKQAEDNPFVRAIRDVADPPPA